MKNKIKHFIDFIFPYLNIATIFIDILLCILLYRLIPDDEDVMIWKYAIIAFAIFELYRFGKSLFMVIRSKNIALDYLNSNRVIAICGKQGSGKTSLSLYFCSLLGSPVYSNAPAKIKGKFTRKLTVPILSAKEKIPLYSICHVDEANLYYNNLTNSSSVENANIFGQSCFEQLCRHFTDGNIIYSCTDVDRLPKELRDNYSCRLQTLGQQTYNYSFVSAVILKILLKPFGKYRFGVRIWNAQHYEKISTDRYFFDLASEKKNDRDAFSSVFTFASFQSPRSFVYDDRYMSGLYDMLPDADSILWDNLHISPDDLKSLYDSRVLSYFSRVIERAKKPSSKN